MKTKLSKTYSKFSITKFKFYFTLSESRSIPTSATFQYSSSNHDSEQEKTFVRQKMDEKRLGNNMMRLVEWNGLEVRFAVEN